MYVQACISAGKCYHPAMKRTIAIESIKHVICLLLLPVALFFSMPWYGLPVLGVLLWKLFS
jgi:hypothetical protein